MNADMFECKSMDDGDSFKKLLLGRVEKSDDKYSDGESPLMYVGKKKYVMVEDFVNRIDLHYNLKIRPDDYVVCSMPRSGTTVTMEMVWLIANGMNFEEANRRHLSERYCKLEDFVELGSALESEARGKMYIDIADTFSSPRFLQIHGAFSLYRNIFDAGKIIYVLRNPKDVIVSAFHFLKNHKFMKFSGTIEEFVNSYTNGLIRWTPHWEQVKEAWAEKHRPNLMILFYEDISNDLLGTLKKVAKFLGKDQYSDDDFAKLVDHLNITNFRRNGMVNAIRPNGEEILNINKYIRKGLVNGWKEELSEDLAKKINEWTAKNIEGTGIVFPE